MANDTDKAHLTFNAFKIKLTMGIPKYIGEKERKKAKKNYKQMSRKYCRNLIIKRIELNTYTLNFLNDSSFTFNNFTYVKV